MKIGRLLLILYLIGCVVSYIYNKRRLEQFHIENKITPIYSKEDRIANISMSFGSWFTVAGLALKSSETDSVEDKTASW